MCTRSRVIFRAKNDRAKFNASGLQTRVLIGDRRYLSASMELDDCTKEEFDAFIAAYPRELVRKNIMVVEPPIVSFLDPTLGQWPECTVAHYSGAPRDVPRRFRIARSLLK